jgi:hypothetical protein
MKNINSILRKLLIDFSSQQRKMWYFSISSLLWEFWCPYLKLLDMWTVFLYCIFLFLVLSLVVKIIQSLWENGFWKRYKLWFLHNLLQKMWMISSKILEIYDRNKHSMSSKLISHSSPKPNQNEQQNIAKFNRIIRSKAFNYKTLNFRGIFYWKKINIFVFSQTFSSFC